MKFCDQTVAFQTHIFRIFFQCFHCFLSSNIRACGSEGGEGVWSLHTACYI